MSTNTLGRYQVIREIARSNDIVYEARDPIMGRRIAIKELQLPPTLVGQARRERIERFYREAKAAGSLAGNPRIVTIYDYGQEGDRYYIVMEYLEGRPLRDLLQMEGALPVERARQMVVKVCDALEYAHARGVIHRDIKPDNIQVLPGDEVKLTDFGIARIAADPTLTADGQVFGTPSYMSPEQVAGKPLDARTDIYSLGVMLYEMLTGRKPFTGDSVVTITYNIMNQEPPAMTGVPPEMQQVVLRAMVKSPDGRFRTATEMRAALLAARTTTGNVTSGRFAPSPTVLPGSAPAGGAPQYGPAVGGPFSPAGAAQYGPAPQPTGVPAANSGPEPTPMDPPPVYVPRRPSAVGKFLKGNSSFLMTLVVAVVLSLACAFFIWAASTAYRSYQQQAKEAQGQAILQRGVAYFNSQRYQEAIAEFRRTIEVAPGTNAAKTAVGNCAAAYINQGNSSLDNRQWPQAAQSYEAALQYDDRSAAAHYGLGMAYHNLNRENEALEQWQWVLDNAPGDAVSGQARHSIAVAYLNLGVQAMSAGQYGEADNYLGRCTATEPNGDAAQRATTLRQQILERMSGPGFSPGM